MKNSTKTRIIAVIYYIFALVFIFALAFTIIIFREHKAEEESVVIHQTAVSEEDVLRIERLEKAYLEAKAQLIEAQEVNAYLEQVVQAFEDEKQSILEQNRSEFMDEIRLQNFCYLTRVGLSEFEDNQITNWFSTYAGTDEDKPYAFYDFLQALLPPEKYEAYVGYVDDLREISRRKRAADILSDLVFLNLSDEQKDMIYDEAYLSTEEYPPFKALNDQFSDFLLENLSEDQMTVFEQRINL